MSSRVNQEDCAGTNKEVPIKEGPEPSSDQHQQPIAEPNVFLSEMTFVQNDLLNGSKSYPEKVSDALEEENPSYSQGNCERS